MRQLQYTSPAVLEWKDVAEPVITKANEAIVRPLFVSRCELDRFIALGTLGWDGGFAFGHEIYGEVVDVGDDVSNFKPGDCVVVPFQISCGACGRCRAGYTALCEAFPYRSSYGMAPLSGVDYGGALSDLVLVPCADHMLVTAPENADPMSIVPVTDTIATSYALIAKPLLAYPNARVLIIGGTAGALHAVKFAVGLGADKVVLIGQDDESLRIAKSFGAEAINSELDFSKTQSLGRFQITIDATGTEEGLSLAIYHTDHEGLCQTVYGGVSERTPVPLQHMYGTNINLKIGRVHARHHMPAALEMITSGCLHDDPIVSHRIPFSDSARVMTEPAHGMVFYPD